VDKNVPDDRRRYFRISENMGLAFRIVADEQRVATREVSDQPVNIYEILTGYDATITRLLEQLRPREPVVTELVACLNKKINCVINQLEMESRMIEQFAHKIYEVNISACGLAFQVEEAISKGTQVLLDLILFPESHRISTRAVVVACEGGYLRMDFVDMSTPDQEVLIQHIVKRQGDLLRSAREQAEVMALEEPPVPPSKSAGV
jgi:hypothetical protein